MLYVFSRAGASWSQCLFIPSREGKPTGPTAAGRAGWTARWSTMALLRTGLHASLGTPSVSPGGTSALRSLLNGTTLVSTELPYYAINNHVPFLDPVLPRVTYLCVSIFQHRVLCCAVNVQWGLHYHLHMVHLRIMLVKVKRRFSLDGWKI